MNHTEVTNPALLLSANQSVSSFPPPLLFVIPLPSFSNSIPLQNWTITHLLFLHFLSLHSILPLSLGLAWVPRSAGQTGRFSVAEIVGCFTNDGKGVVLVCVCILFVCVCVFMLDGELKYTLFACLMSR